MKLKELLEIIPENYEVGLADFDKDICTISYFKKEDAIMGFAQKAPMMPTAIPIWQRKAFVFCASGTTMSLGMSRAFWKQY